MVHKQLWHLRGSQSRVVFQQGRRQLHSLDRRKCWAAARSGRVVAAGAAAEADGEVGENPKLRQTYTFNACFLPSFLPQKKKKNPTLVCSRSFRAVRRTPPPPFLLLLLPPDRISCTLLSPSVRETLPGNCSGIKSPEVQRLTLKSKSHKPETI